MGDVKYKATMTRAWARELFVDAEMAEPPHRAAMKWLSSLASELHEHTQYEIDVTNGAVKAKRSTALPDDDVLTLELSRESVLAIRMLCLRELLGGKRTATGVSGPAGIMRRAQVLKMLKGVGPDGILARQVDEAAVLPESKDLDDEKLDLEPKKEA
jgi:hypothetical protein